MESLIHLVVIWAGVFVAVFAARKTRLTPVLYFLAVGAILVNVGFLPKEPDPFIRTFADIGIILIMFALGFEENTEKFVASIKRSWGIAFFGAVAPFLTAYFISEYFWDDVRMSLLFGLAMTATAVSLTMVSLRSENLSTSPAATGIMTSAVLDDVASLALVAIVVPIATGQAEPAVLDIVWVVIKALLFFVIVTLIGSWFFPHEPTGFLKRIPILRSVGIKHVLGLEEGDLATLTVLTIALLVGILAHTFGLHPAIGAYMAGLVLREEYFDFTNERQVSYYRATKSIVDNAAYSWVGPVFFVALGAHIVLDWSILNAVLFQTLVLTAGLFFAQIASAGLAARYTGGFSSAESLMIGFGMLGRAELAFVVMDIAYVQFAILNDEAFYTLMFTAFSLNIAVPLTIRWWKPYYTGDKRLFGRRMAAR